MKYCASTYLRLGLTRSIKTRLFSYYIYHVRFANDTARNSDFSTYFEVQQESSQVDLFNGTNDDDPFPYCTAVPGTVHNIVESVVRIFSSTSDHYCICTSTGIVPAPRLPLGL